MKTINQQHFYFCFNISTKLILYAHIKIKINQFCLLYIYTYIFQGFFFLSKGLTTQNKKQNNKLNKNISSNMCERVKAKRVSYFVCSQSSML